MAAGATSVTELWSVFRSLSPDSRDKFMELMIADPAVREELEDLVDLKMAQERLREPTRPLEDVLAELTRYICD